MHLPIFVAVQRDAREDCHYSHDLEALALDAMDLDTCAGLIAFVEVGTGWAGRYVRDVTPRAVELAAASYRRRFFSLPISEWPAPHWMIADAVAEMEADARELAGMLG